MLNSLVFVHKIQRGNFRTTIQYDKIQKGLRNDGDLVPAKSLRNFLKRDISHFGAILYNNLSDAVKSSKSIYAFKRSVKKLLQDETSKVLAFTIQNLKEILKTKTKDQRSTRLSNSN